MADKHCEMNICVCYERITKRTKQTCKLNLRKYHRMAWKLFRTIDLIPEMLRNTEKWARNAQIWPNNEMTKSEMM